MLEDDIEAVALEPRYSSLYRVPIHELGCWYKQLLAVVPDLVIEPISNQNQVANFKRKQDALVCLLSFYLRVFYYFKSEFLSGQVFNLRRGDVSLLKCLFWRALDGSLYFGVVVS